MLSTISPVATLPVVAPTDRSNVLYGSTDPAKNLATVRALAMTDEARYQAGWDDGFHNRGARGSLSGYPAYWEGWSAGRAAAF